MKWCIARYEGEWFRAYIEDIHENRIQVFFVDYGTSTLVRYADTCTPPCAEEDIWAYQPLALPLVVKDMTPVQFNKFKRLQYIQLDVHSMKLIEDV